MTVEDPKMTCIYYSFWEGLAAGAEIYEGATSWVTTVPSNDAVLVLTYFPQGQFSRVRSNAVRAHLDAVEATAPALFVRMRSARQKEKIWGTGDQQNFFRAAAGPGWALVGDAGHHKDSITALGITDALAQAELLVSHIAGNLSNPQELNEALARFAADRDALLIPGYRATLATAKLLTDIDIPENEQRLDFLRTVAADRTLTQLYFDVFARIKSFTELADALNT
jgi:2-polyprenyl-6-methoxyphenol hydroxylase-like FAD-dependent oxidoreductase